MQCSPLPSQRVSETGLKIKVTVNKKLAASFETLIIDFDWPPVLFPGLERGDYNFKTLLKN
jgi:hypothetical protein